MNYDIIVLGAGSAGLNIAVFMNRIGLKVLMVEKHLVGGDCLNFGCVPSKALISLAHTAHYARKATKFGIKVAGTVNLKKVATIIKTRQDFINKHENPEYFRKQGIAVELGSPQFLGKNAIEVNGKRYTARKIVIATGSRPSIPKLKGIEKVLYLTNETIFKNNTLPKRFLVIGGGPIGVEIAQAYARLGAKVTILERSGQILPKEEPEMAKIIENVLRKEGIEIKYGYTPMEFIDKHTLLLKPYDKEQKKAYGKTLRITFDQVLIATGRNLNVEGLELEKAGIAIKNHRIVVDTYLRTTNKKVYVCGDVAGSYMFTHWAETQAAMLIKNLLSPFKKTLDPTKIAWVTYTDPELATFGLQLNKIKAKGITFKTLDMEIKDVDRAITEGITEGKLKLYVNKKGLILGGTMAAKNAGELAGELIGAMTLKIPYQKLFERIYPYPTMSRITRKAIGKTLGEKLTPSSSKLLRTLYKLFN